MHGFNRIHHIRSYSQSAPRLEMMRRYGISIASSRCDFPVRGHGPRLRTSDNNKAWYVCTPYEVQNPNHELGNSPERIPSTYDEVANGIRLIPS